MKKKRKPASVRRPQGYGLATSKAIKGISDTNIALLLGLFGFLLYANTLRHGYVIDDDLAISLNENVRRGLGGIVDIFNQPYRQECFGGCLYRPLTLTTFAIEWAMSPNNPFTGHLMNVIWYSATASLLFLTIRKFIPQFHIVIPLVAVILFTAHPVHTEVVANIKSRDEILSLFFVILSFYNYAKWHETKSWVDLSFAALSLLAGLLSKEGAISALPVFPLLGWIFFNRSFGASVKNSWWMIVPVLLFFLLRGAALSGLTEPDIHMMDNAIVDAKGSELPGTAFTILLKYLLLLILPLQLQSDYSYNVIPLQSLTNINSLAGLLIYIALVVYAIYGLYRRWITGFIAAAFLSSIVLYSHLLKVIGTMMAERLAYAPSLWFVLGLTAALSVILKT
jgi:protein O-mannosyl-transferase